MPKKLTPLHLAKSTAELNKLAAGVSHQLKGVKG